MAFFVAPEDYQQGKTVRIMFVHVPSAWLSMGGYAMLSALGASLLVWRHPLAALMARAAAPVGASFAAVCLLTARLGPADVGHLLGVGRAPHLDAAAVLSLSRPHRAQPRLRPARARRSRGGDPGADRRDHLPIIKFSVDWWNTLHQPASITRLDAPAIHNSILVPLLWMAVLAAVPVRLPRAAAHRDRDRSPPPRECRGCA